MTFKEFLSKSTGAQLWQIFSGVTGTANESRALGPIREIEVGADWANLEDVSCRSVIFHNTSGFGIKVRREATPDFSILIPNDTGIEIDVTENADELQVFQDSDPSSLPLQYFCVGEAI